MGFQPTYQPQLVSWSRIFFHYLPRVFYTSKRSLCASWWFQPIWKICSSNWVHLPQFSGWKFQKTFELPPPSFCCFTHFSPKKHVILPGKLTCPLKIHGWKFGISEPSEPSITLESSPVLDGKQMELRKETHRIRQWPWMYPTTMGFPTKNDHFWVWNGGTTILRKHSYKVGHSKQSNAQFDITVYKTFISLETV